jgi:hypothetical protein
LLRRAVIGHGLRGAPPGSRSVFSGTYAKSHPARSPVDRCRRAVALLPAASGWHHHGTGLWKRRFSGAGRKRIIDSLAPPLSPFRSSNRLEPDAVLPRQNGGARAGLQPDLEGSRCRGLADQRRVCRIDGGDGARLTLIALHLGPAPAPGTLDLMICIGELRVKIERGQHQRSFDRRKVKSLGSYGGRRTSSGHVYHACSSRLFGS